MAFEIRRGERLIFFAEKITLIAQTTLGFSAHRQFELLRLFVGLQKAKDGLSILEKFKFEPFFLEPLRTTSRDSVIPDSPNSLDIGSPELALFLLHNKDIIGDLYRVFTLVVEEAPE